MNDNSLGGADVAESSLGMVPSAGNAANSDKLGGQSPAAYQLHCARGSTFPIAMCPASMGSQKANVGPGLTIGVGCNGGETGDLTDVIFYNNSPGGVTLNWLYSDGTTVHASGTAIQSGHYDVFGFNNKRLEGQWIFNASNAEITVNLHAFDGGSFCEITGTAETATL